jgi:hydroxymethylglutaryl-CoA lyase
MHCFGGPSTLRRNLDGSKRERRKLQQFLAKNRNYSEMVKIIECPRDAWQGLPKNMPAEVKADYLRVLIAAGFKHIDAVSFVSRTAVPQMADSELVMEYLDPPDDVEIIGIVVNGKGAERAVKTGSVQTLGFPYSISPEFLKRNQAGMDVVAYISMAFGNPYGEPWDIDEVVAACDLLADNGVKQISLADTVGLATPKQVSDVVSDLIAVHDNIEIGVHLHARPDNAAAKVRAAYEAGCRRFDAAIGGLGGCPFAQDALVGNMATETLLAELKALGVELPPLRSLDGLIAASAEIAKKYGAHVQ